MENEIWKWLHQSIKYEISSFGRVKKIWYIKNYSNWYFRYQKEDKYINPTKWKYLRVSIDKRLYSVHRLVAQAFLWLDINDKKMFVCHKDDNTFNNRTDNLFLWKAKDNTQDCINKWRMKWNFKLTINEAKEIINKFTSWIKQKELSVQYNVSRSCISMITSWKNFKYLNI